MFPAPLAIGTHAVDMLELSKALQPSFTPEQAEALGKASSDPLATKADIIELKSEISTVRREMKTLEANLTRMISAQEAKIAGSMTALEANLTGIITAQISLLRAETIKWIVSALAFNFVATAGLIITLTKVFGK